MKEENAGFPDPWPRGWLILLTSKLKGYPKRAKKPFREGVKRISSPKVRNPYGVSFPVSMEKNELINGAEGGIQKKPKNFGKLLILL